MYDAGNFCSQPRFATVAAEPQPYRVFLSDLVPDAQATP